MAGYEWDKPTCIWNSLDTLAEYFHNENFISLFLFSACQEKKIISIICKRNGFIFQEKKKIISIFDALMFGICNVLAQANIVLTSCLFRQQFKVEKLKSFEANNFIQWINNITIKSQLFLFFYSFTKTFISD